MHQNLSDHFQTVSIVLVSKKQFLIGSSFSTRKTVSYCFQMNMFLVKDKRVGFENLILFLNSGMS